jgi:phage portal protein BeeE
MLERLFNLLRAPEAKASRTAQLIQFESGGRARWTPRDYAALSREGYVCNAIVHRAVKLVAENVAASQFLVYEGAVQREPHPLLDLLARPNPRQEGAAFLESVCAYLLLAGNAYVEAVTVEGQGSSDVRELYALRPDRMRVVPGPDGWPEAYDYVLGVRSVRFAQNAPLPPILHLTQFHPLDDHYGLSSLEAAAVAVELALLECPAFTLTLLHALWIGHDAGINGFANLSALLMTYFGARFGVLGVYVSGRTREKQAGATGDLPPTVIGQLLKALAPNKKK